MKNKLQQLIDGFFSFLLFLLVFYSIGKTFCSGQALILFSLDMTFLSQCVYLAWSEKNRIKGNRIENLKNTFAFTSTTPFDLLLPPLAEKFNAKKNGDYLIVNDVCIVTCFLTTLSYSTCADLYKKRPVENIIILCFDADYKAKRLLSYFPSLEIWEKDKTYKLFLYLNAFPKKEFRKIRKFDFKQYLSALPTFSVSKRYLFSSLVLFTLSFLSPLFVYYRVFAVISLAIAVLPPLLNAIIKK